MPGCAHFIRAHPTRHRRVTSGCRLPGRYDASSDAFRRTMAVQSQIVEASRDDAEALAAAIARSQGADGSLAAAQATNQLLALTAKQQLALQQMMAAQFRADALEKQRQLTESEASRAATRKFLGTGNDEQSKPGETSDHDHLCAPVTCRFLPNTGKAPASP